MDLRNFYVLQQIIEQLVDFSYRVRHGSQDEKLREEAQQYIDILSQLPNTLNYFFVGEGKSDTLVRPPEAEILRNPLRPEEDFSCVPIFIIGNRRSGTTLLSYLLNAADGISALPESFVASDVVSSDRLFQAAHRAMKELDEPFPRFLIRVGHFVDSIYGDYARAQGKKRWVSKEMFIPHKLDLLDAVFDYRARFIYAVRHGLSVAHSCASRFPMRDGLPLNELTGLDLGTYVNEWVANNESTMDFYERNRERCFLLRYEEFTKSPMSVGRKLFEFLQERWDDEFISKRLGEQRLRGMGDNKILVTKGKILAAEEPWRSWPGGLRITLGRRANPTLERLGYERVE